MRTKYVNYVSLFIYYVFMDFFSVNCPGPFPISSGWGPVPNRHICQDEGMAHKLRITVRAWHDPYIKAAELTHGSMDFGLSGSTELITGSVWLGSVGCQGSGGEN